MLDTGMCARAFATERLHEKPPLTLSSDLVQRQQSRKVTALIQAAFKTSVQCPSLLLSFPVYQLDYHT